MEASSITGPAKNMLRFASSCKVNDEAPIQADLSFLTFYRNDVTQAPPRTDFLRTIEQLGLSAIKVRESHAWDPNVIERVYSAIHDFHPDIIQSHSTKSHFLLGLIAKRLCTPWIAFHHGYTNENLKVRLYNQLNRWSLRRALGVVTVCKPFAVQLIKQGIRPQVIRILPNSIELFPPTNPETAIEARKELGVPSDTFLLLAIGRLSEEKGHKYLIQAIADLQRQSFGAEIVLVLAGDGPERSSLERSAKNQRVNVQFLGHVRSVERLYAAADCFILPSLSEGSPNVLLEAMAHGRPIIATHVGGIEEMVTNEQEALLVAPRNARQLSAAIATILSDRTAANALASRARVRVQEFSPQAHKSRLLNLYSDAIQGHWERNAPTQAQHQNAP